MFVLKVIELLVTVFHLHYFQLIKLKESSLLSKIVVFSIKELVHQIFIYNYFITKQILCLEYRYFGAFPIYFTIPF